MVFPVITPSMKFFWNIDENVGIASPNRTDDILFVQFGYFTLGKSTKLSFVTPEQREVYKEVTPGDGFSAVESDPLIRAIRMHQRSRGGVQDGHVSRVRGSTGTYTEGGETLIFMLSVLVVAIQKENPDHWPKLHLMDKCPTRLAEISREVFRF